MEVVEGGKIRTGVGATSTTLGIGPAEDCVKERMCEKTDKM